MLLCFKKLIALIDFVEWKAAIPAGIARVSRPHRQRDAEEARAVPAESVRLERNKINI